MEGAGGRREDTVRREGGDGARRQHVVAIAVAQLAVAARTPREQPARARDREGELRAGRARDNGRVVERRRRPWRVERQQR
eukprot:2391065-Prymnesium_polylepis.1